MPEQGQERAQRAHRRAEHDQAAEAVPVVGAHSPGDEAGADGHEGACEGQPSADAADGRRAGRSCGRDVSAIYWCKVCKDEREERNANTRRPSILAGRSRGW